MLSRMIQRRLRDVWGWNRDWKVIEIIEKWGFHLRVGEGEVSNVGIEVSDGLRSDLQVILCISSRNLFHAVFQLNECGLQSRII